MGKESTKNDNTLRAERLASLPQRYFDRDISWLSFNERVLMEAARADVPLYERLKFLAIYSSNLDEFYRVRMAAIVALNDHPSSDRQLLTQVTQVIQRHQNLYGQILRDAIVPELRNTGITLLYNGKIPDLLNGRISQLFYTHVAGLVQVIQPRKSARFFPENNKLFLAVSRSGQDDIYFVNIPSDSLDRFYTITAEDTTYVVIIDDIIRQHISALLGGTFEGHICSFKITRDAELNLSDEIGAPLTAQLEKLLAVRDNGDATRLLYDASMPDYMLKRIVKMFKLTHASQIAGGRYHNLRDFFTFPKLGAPYRYPPQPRLQKEIAEGSTLFGAIAQRDMMLHTPYQSYDLILRFFNEAAIHPHVEKIYITLYRIAEDSAIAQTLITAAKNGKKVYVMVELKARFDEANNMRWAAKMKEAGVSIAYSGARMKVHAKMALVKGTADGKRFRYGLLATGNFNENTARLYTDHILLTARNSLLREVQSLFKILMKEVKSVAPAQTVFKELIVAPFNIRERFFALIDREIDHVKQGRRGAITIKLNNLEEETLIDKLYAASAGGVQVQLIVRSICRLIPGKPGLSDNITVKRIVDRYLEHGRVFIFHNNGNDEVYCGSADWMNRNIYHRIEVCFPVHDPQIREALMHIIDLQCRDTKQAVLIDEHSGNIPIESKEDDAIRSQVAIYDMLATGNKPQ